MKTFTLATSALALAFSFGTAATADGHAGKAAVLDTYADIAKANYADSLTTAKRLQAAVDALIADPSAEALDAARDAWLAARVPYQQSEVFRFGNAIVDDWEGKVNAWPLDEGLIDYVDASYGGPTDENAAAVLNVIANASFELSGETVDAVDASPRIFWKTRCRKLMGSKPMWRPVITPSNSCSGGQDLNGHGAGAGDRPWTDYAAGDLCTNGNCDRRGEYLQSGHDASGFRS